MTDIAIPADILELVQSAECVDWIVEHCPHSVQGISTPEGFVVRFADEGEASAFRARWLAT